MHQVSKTDVHVLVHSPSRQSLPLHKGALEVGVAISVLRISGVFEICD